MQSKRRIQSPGDCSNRSYIQVKPIINRLLGIGGLFLMVCPEHGIKCQYNHNDIIHHFEIFHNHIPPPSSKRSNGERSSRLCTAKCRSPDCIRRVISHRHHYTIFDSICQAQIFTQKIAKKFPKPLDKTGILCYNNKVNKEERSVLTASN